MPDWQMMFNHTSPLFESVVRGTVTYLVVLLVVLVAQAAAPGLSGVADSITDSVVSVVTILFWSVVIDALSYRFPAMSHLLKSRPRPLIHQGRLNRRVMRREFMTEEEVTEQLRLYGVQDISSVERAYIEPNGMISVLQRPGKEPE